MQIYFFILQSTQTGFPVPICLPCLEISLWNGELFFACSEKLSVALGQIVLFGSIIKYNVYKYYLYIIDFCWTFVGHLLDKIIYHFYTIRVIVRCVQYYSTYSKRIERFWLVKGCSLERGLVHCIKRYTRCFWKR